MIRLAVFDIAGTTIEEHQAVYRALRAAVEAGGGAPSSSDIEAWMGADKREAITALLATGGTPAPSSAQVDTTFVDFRARLDDEYRRNPPAPITGVPPVLERLRDAGIKVALTTGFDREVTTGILDAVGWRDGVLDAVICVDDVSAGRPAPYMIFRAMEATGVTRVAEVLTAGDTIRDLEAGTNAGAAIVIGVLSGASPATTLTTYPHTHILASLAEVPDLLRSLGQPI